MAENTNINNNSAVVVVGRTAPVPTGQQSAEKSIPVVIASDQEAIPVEEQNKQQSEVALSLLGIPRSEVALGIFADVNTYDVNPTEWSADPVQLKTVLPSDKLEYTDIPGQQDWGLSHVPSEAGAHIEAPANEYAILTSKRFFRYQPGRVSAGTFGVKFGRSPYTVHTSLSDYPSGTNGVDYLLSTQLNQVRHSSVKKYGVFDKFDGYYYESVNEGRGDNFTCVRRTQSLIQQKSQDFFYSSGAAAQTNPRQFGVKQYEDYGNMELPGQGYRGDAVILRDGLINIHAGLFDVSLLKEKRDIVIESSSGTELVLSPNEIRVSNFSYNNVTGKATVTTAGDHGLNDGDSVTVRDLLVSCNTGEKLYPNKYAQTIFRVNSANTNSFEVFIGESQYNNIFSQQYVSGTGFAKSVSNLGAGSSKTVSNFVYTNATGVATITLTTAHDLNEGDRVQLSGIALNGGVTFPRSSDPDIFYVRKVVSSKIIEVGVGKPAVSKLDQTTNTYSSGGTLAKVSPSFNATKAISNFQYDTATGYVTITSNGHGYTAGSRINLSDIQTICSYGPKNYPAKDDPDTFAIYDVTSNTFSFQLETSTISHTYVSGGRVISQGLAPGSSIYVYKNGNTLNSVVDGGIYFVNSVTGSKVTLTKSPTNGDDLTVFPSSDTQPLNFGTNEFRLTVANVNYNPTGSATTVALNSGVQLDPGYMRVQINSHGLSEGDSVKFEDYSITFTCEADANATNHSYPRPTDPASNKFLRISNVTVNTFDVQVLDTIPSITANGRTAHTFVSAETNGVIKSPSAGPYIVTPAPFILPNTTNYSYKGSPNTTDPDIIDTLNPYGCFPYRYVYGDDDASIVGYISTDVKLTTTEGANTIRTGIDYVNNNLLKDWVYNHVKPQYWSVYEYRVPRSRFSGEKVDGQSDSDVLYSDVVYSDGTNNFPGEPVIDPATDGRLTRTSNWNLNPANVTMYKIEFSWYGAVGALFLAYVPLDSGEARWVRVHHLRASNQLKVSSLGNPTLPITYYVYGGGTQYSYGYKNDRRQLNYIANSSSYSEYLVKYGASYYIDGGDRGTVRLFNYATPATSEVYGSKLSFTLTSGDNEGAGADPTDPYPYLNIGDATNNTGLTVTDYTYYMNATVITPGREPGVKVIWVDSAAGKIYLNRPINDSQAGNFFLVLDRPRILIGLKCRENINGVRNRVQVYPTRLSIGNAGNYATVKLVKSPIFQTKDTISGVFNTTYTISNALNIGSIAKPVQLNSTQVTNQTYLEVVTSTYGYFRGFYDGDSTNIITIFGLLRRDASGNYFFNAQEKTNINLLIFGNFLRAGEFYEPNPTSISAGAFTPTSTPLTALSAISISDEQRTPIPGTGQQITTLFTPANSGEQFELQQFFDYNKDYLSFPLTNDIETLFILASESNLYNDSQTATDMSAAITWEEQ